MSVRLLARPKLDYVSADGTVPMCIRISIDGKSDWIKLGRSMKVASWDKESSRVKSGVLHASHLERFFESRKSWIQEIVERIEEEPNSILTKEEVQKRYDERAGRGAIRTTCFIDFIEDYLDWEEENDDRAGDRTVDILRNRLKWLKSWWYSRGNNVRKEKPLLQPVLITKQFLLEYATHVRRKYPNNEAAAWTAHSFMRKYLKRLKAKGVINVHPYDEQYAGRIIVGTPPMTEVEYFGPEELVELTNLFFSEKLLDAEQKQNGKHDSTITRFDLGARLQSTLHHFLIGCYTGLRRSDVERLNKLHHVKGDFIVIQVKKGRSGKRATVRIPIKQVVRKLLDYVSPRLETHAERGAFKDSGRIFYLDMIAANSQNKYMRQIVDEYTGITKDYFNYHTSRHTFGVVSLILGLKLEVVKDMLGHAEIETTMRYAKVVDRLREMDMCKWDALIDVGAGPIGSDSSSKLVKIECPKCGSVGGSYEPGLFDMPRLAVVCRVCGSGFGHEVV